MPDVPRFFYGEWPELERIELGERAAFTYDEASSLEHRFARAGGPPYGCPPRHWSWERHSLPSFLAAGGDPA